jgi:hypothetical protein
MKRIVSISLGASRRDYRCTVTVLGRPIEIARIGTDGDAGRVRSLVRQHDGAVDAIGLGGLAQVFRVGAARYPNPAAQRIAAAARRTPVVSGSLVSHLLDRACVEQVARARGDMLAGRALVLSGVARYTLAEALASHAAALRCADPLIYGGAPLVPPLRSLAQLELYAATVLPLAALLPAAAYAAANDEHDARAAGLFAWADLVAGDFGHIRRFAPRDLAGKIIVTDEPSPEEVLDLRKRGAAALVTLSPNLGGARPYVAADVLAAIAVAVMECDADPPAGEMAGFVEAAGWGPDVLQLSTVSPAARGGRRALP